MANKDDKIELTYSKKNYKDELKQYLNYVNDRQKNFSRLDSIVVTECGKRCLSNFKFIS